MPIQTNLDHPFQFIRGIRCRPTPEGFWFAASDVAKRMKVQTGSITQRLLDEDLRSRYTETRRGHRDMTFISEKALYEVIFRSRNPWAEAARTELIEALKKTTLDKLGEALMIPSTPSDQPD